MATRKSLGRARKPKAPKKAASNKTVGKSKAGKILSISRKF